MDLKDEVQSPFQGIDHLLPAAFTPCTLLEGSQPTWSYHGVLNEFTVAMGENGQNKNLWV